LGEEAAQRFSAIFSTQGGLSLHYNIVNLGSQRNKKKFHSILSQLLKGKGKASSLDIAPLTILNSGALQPRKWQLTGNDCSTAAHAVAAQSPR